MSLSLRNRLKQKFWRLLYPVFPYLQRPFAYFHTGRQPYHLGWLAPGHTLSDLKAHLIKQGFGNHFIAWDDTGQVLSWRKFDGFEWQYHIRVFNDGEIRSHHEPTPEAAPLKHLTETGETARTEDFMYFLGDFVTTEKHVTQLEPDATAKDVESQILYEHAH